MCGGGGGIGLRRIVGTYNVLVEVGCSLGKINCRYHYLTNMYVSLLSLLAYSRIMQRELSFITGYRIMLPR